MASGSEWLWTLLALSGVSSFGLIGAVTLLLKPRALQRALIVLVSFAAGALLGDAFLHMIPEIAESPTGFDFTASLAVLAGITGSASGGMSIALQTLGDTFRDLAESQGISLELMHRVTVIASGGFDALPHNGAVITLLAICGLTHRQSYKDIAVVAVVIPVLALIVVIALGTVFGGF